MLKRYINRFVEDFLEILILSTNFLDVWECDLVDVQACNFNDNYMYLLIVIDLY